MKEHLTKEEATDFFKEFYHGEHHFPSKLKPFGYGWVIRHKYGGLSTYDFNDLTRLVVMAHDKCIRAEIMPSSQGHVKIAIWKRQREGGISHSHPTIEEHIKQIRKA